MKKVLQYIESSADQLKEFDFEPNNNQKGLAANAVYHMYKMNSRDRIEKMIVTFPAGHGKSRVVPTFIKAMFLMGKTFYAKIIFLHKEQRDHDMPIIQSLMADTDVTIEE